MMVFGLHIGWGVSEEEQTETRAELARLTGTEGSRWQFEWRLADSLSSKGHWIFTTKNLRNQAYSKLMQAYITPEKTEADGIITLTISHREISTYLAEKKEREEREEAAAKEKASNPTPRPQSPTPTGGLTREALQERVGIVRVPANSTPAATPTPDIHEQIVARLNQITADWKDNSQQEPNAQNQSQLPSPESWTANWRYIPKPNSFELCFNFASTPTTDQFTHLCNALSAEIGSKLGNLHIPHTLHNGFGIRVDKSVKDLHRFDITAQENNAKLATPLSAPILTIQTDDATVARLLASPSVAAPAPTTTQPAQGR